MDAGGLAEGRFLTPPSLRKGRGLAGPEEDNSSACLGLVQGDTAVLPVRYDRGLDRPPGGGKVDGTSAQQPPRLREHRLTKGADKILLGESDAANPRLRLLLRCGGGPAHDWKIPLANKMRGVRRHASVKRSDAARKPRPVYTATALKKGQGSP